MAGLNVSTEVSSPSDELVSVETANEDLQKCDAKLKSVKQTRKSKEQELSKV